MPNPPDAEANATRLWYRQPAESFNEALPLGNGRLGAMIFGRPWRREDYYSERIVLNEETIWHGGPTNRENPQARAALARVRERLLSGHVGEAEYLADMAMTGVPRNGHPYQALGELVFTSLNDPAGVENYRRDLDLDSAIARVRYDSAGALYETEAFVSAPANVLAIRLRCTGAQRLNFHAYLRRRPFDGDVFREHDSTVGITGQAGPGGVLFAGALRAIAAEGGVRVLGQSIEVQNAGEVVLLVAAASDFRGEDPKSTCLRTLEEASLSGYEALRQAHVEDHRRLFRRVSIRLGRDRPGTPTDVRLADLQGGGEDPGLAALHFQFARYLLIASSRPGTLPVNLQGIWCESMMPIWNCNYTIDINLQMDYWPAETANLAECHRPLFDFLERLVARGQRTAREMYGCRGFVAHHTSDLWAETAPTGGVYAAALWPMGGAWLALHVWEHYLFTQDRDFLAACYPILREAALFFCDFLVENRDGEMVAVPSVSPENGYRLPDGTKAKMAAGVAMDGQILHELFSATAEAALRLGVDDALRCQVLALRDRLPPIRVNRHGGIQEWLEDYEENDVGHRHLSHLFALHPGGQISPLDPSPLAAAAARTLQRRLSQDNDRTGWSLSWMANHFARLFDGPSAHACLGRVLREFTHPSLFNNCPPLNIDGNFGCASAIAEMLLQSHRGELHLLPALPPAWADGEVRGLCARGGFTVSIFWNEGKLRQVEVQASQATVCRLRAPLPLAREGKRLDMERSNDFFCHTLAMAAGERVSLAATEPC